VSDPNPKRNPPAPEESAHLSSSHKPHGRRRKRKKSKRVKNIITVLVLLIMVVVIIWFAIRAVMTLGGHSSD
jgi:hypothetical protein